MKRWCPVLLGASEGNHLRTAGGPTKVRTGLVSNTIEKRESEFAGLADRTCFVDMQEATLPHTRAKFLPRWT